MKSIFDEMKRLQKIMEDTQDWTLQHVPEKHRAMKTLQKIMEDTQKRINRLFEAEKWATAIRSPFCEVRETGKNVIVRAELPGIDKKNIDLNISGRSMEIRANAKKEEEKKGKKSYSYAASAKQFYRLLPLPAEVQPDKAKAEYKNGILKIEIPKARESRKKKIAIK